MTENLTTLITKLREVASQYDPKDPEIQAVFALATSLEAHHQGDETAISRWKADWVQLKERPLLE